MRAVVPYVSPACGLLLQTALATTLEKHNTARAELGEVLKKVELVVSNEYEKPNRIIEASKAREIVEEDLAALGKAMTGLAAKVGKLEQVRKIVLEGWGVEE